MSFCKVLPNFSFTISLLKFSSIHLHQVAASNVSNNIPFLLLVIYPLIATVLELITNFDFKPAVMITNIPAGVFTFTGNAKRLQFESFELKSSSEMSKKIETLSVSDIFAGKYFLFTTKTNDIPAIFSQFQSLIENHEHQTLQKKHNCPQVYNLLQYILGE